MSQGLLGWLRKLRKTRGEVSSPSVQVRDAMTCLGAILNVGQDTGLGLGQCRQDYYFEEAVRRRHHNSDTHSGTHCLFQLALSLVPEY